MEIIERNNKSRKHQLTLTDNTIGLADNLLSSTSLFYTIAHQIWVGTQNKNIQKKNTQISN